jgi:hypothetical protein
MVRARAITHIDNEVGEVTPAIANLDTATAIQIELGVVLILTPSEDATPNPIEGMACTKAIRALLNAAARPTHCGAEAILEDGLLCSAFAAAAVLYIIPAIAVDINLDHFPATEEVTNLNGLARNTTTRARMSTLQRSTSDVPLRSTLTAARVKC